MESNHLFAMLLNPHLEPQFPHCKIGLVIGPTSFSGCEDWERCCQSRVYDNVWCIIITLIFRCYTSFFGILNVYFKIFLLKAPWRWFLSSWKVFTPLSPPSIPVKPTPHCPSRPSSKTRALGTSTPNTSLGASFGYLVLASSSYYIQWPSENLSVSSVWWQAP